MTEAQGGDPDLPVENYEKENNHWKGRRSMYKNESAKLFKKALSVMLAAVMILGILVVPSTDVQAASKKKGAVTKITTAKKSLSLEEGKSKSVKVTVKVTKKASKKFTVKSSSKKVATAKVSGSNVKITAKKAGKATITVTTKDKNKKNKKLSAKIKVTVKAKKKTPASSGSGSSGSGSSGSGSSSSGSSSSGSSNDSIPVSQPTINNPVTDNGFNWNTDVTWVDGVYMGRVDFTINTETTSAEELEAQGYTISSDKKSASKDTTLEYRTYTFKKLPNTERGIKTIPLTGEYTHKASSAQLAEDKANGIGFNTMAATVLTSAMFKGYSNPSDPNGDKEGFIQEIKKSFEYLNGPRASDDIAPAKWQTTVGSMKNATATNQGGNPNVYLSYLGAKSTNFYKDPGSGNYKLTVYRGPYKIGAKETITGKRPETYMIFVGDGDFTDYSGNDWGTDRYIDVWKSSSDGNWYSWQNSFANVTANNFKKAEEGF